MRRAISEEHPICASDGLGQDQLASIRMRWAFLDHPVPFGIAHQGGADIAPGNTEAAFQHAVSLGYRYIETDVQTTADGVLVVFHDKVLGPTTGAAGTIADRTWLELTELRVRGEHPIPRFEDMLDRFPHIRFNVEPKTDLAVDALIDLIRHRALQPRICVGSFSDQRIRKIRRALGPELCMSPGPRGVSRALLAAMRGSKRPSPFGALQIPTSAAGLPLTRKRTIERVRELALQVHVWTVNDEATMIALLDNGVDAIMTDNVTLLRNVLDARGDWSKANVADGSG